LRSGYNNKILNPSFPFSIIARTAIMEKGMPFFASIQPGLTPKKDSLSESSTLAKSAVVREDALFAVFHPGLTPKKALPLHNSPHLRIMEREPEGEDLDQQ
jgi:hypothetical protein